LFYEVVIAPEYDAEAIVLQQKKNRIILIQNEVDLPKTS
jgi:phosphoribosylaminoimidazolecarboxamide formyltransferase/IMP cyclohydrolase